MSRLIDADTLINRIDSIIKVNRLDTQKVWFTPNGAKLLVEEQPTIEERKKGKWKPISDGYVDIYECNQCGETEDYERNYCPNCGADMRGES